MYHQFQDLGSLKNIEEYESTINQRDYPLPGHHQKEMLIPFTQAPGNQLQKVNTRSIKTCPNNIQISFQTDFLHQHVEAIKVQLQKYMESWSNSFKNIPNQKLRQTILNNNEPTLPKNVFEIIDSQKCCLSMEKKSMLKKDLQHQQKLKDLLNQVAVIFKEDVCSEIICLANQIWESYLKIRDQRFDQQELKRWVQVWSQKELPSVQKRFFYNLNFKKGKIERDNGDKNLDRCMHEFLKSLSITIALVIQEYFGNPYYETAQTEDNFKRSSPCSDFEFDDFSQDEENFFVLKKNKIF